MAKASIAGFVTMLLNVSWYFVAVALGIIACIVALSPWMDVSGSSGTRIDIPVSFDVDSGAVQVRAPALGVSAAEIQHVRGSMSFPPPSRASVAGLLSLVAVMLALLLWALGQLIAVFRTLRDRQPFVSENAMRIRRIGYAVIALELTRAVLVFLSNSYAMTHFSADGLHFDARPDVNLFAVVHGLVILAIAEVFRVGTRLHEDQSLTV